MALILEFDPAAFGERVRKFRRARRLSLRHVEDQTGISYATIGRIERADKQAERISARAVVCLALWADINPTDFVKVHRKEGTQ